MAIQFTLPVEAPLPLDPAQSMAENRVILGYTELYYNDVKVTGSEEVPPVFGLLGIQEPRNPSLPTLQTAQVVHVGAPMHRVTVQNPAAHRIKWTVLLPEAPRVRFRRKLMWRSRVTSGTRINEVLRRIDPHAHYPVSEGVIYVEPKPTWHQFSLHVKNHEYQHVADHKWLAQQIIGPLDNWQTHLNGQAVAVLGHTANQAESYVQNGNDYTMTPLRMLDYFIRASGKSGDLFHATRNGMSAKRKIETISFSYGIGRPTGYVVISLTPEQLIGGNVDWNAGSHQNLQLKPINQTINGNERVIPGVPNVRLLPVPGFNPLVLPALDQMNVPDLNGINLWDEGV